MLILQQQRNIWNNQCKEKNNQRKLNGPDVTFGESNPSLPHKKISSKPHMAKVKDITSQKVVQQTPTKKLEPAQDPQAQY